MSKRLHLTLAALAATLTWAASASAAILVNDTWQDGERLQPTTTTTTGPYSENGVDGDLDNDLESVWWTNNVAQMSSSAGHLLLTPATGSSSYTTYFTPEATPVTLAQGQTLRVTWEFTPNGLGTSANRDWRMALVNTGAAERLTNAAGTGTPASSTFTGYRVSMNVSSAASSAAVLDLWERQVLTSDNLLVNNDRWGANGTAGTPLAAATPPGNPPTMANGTKYTFVWTITRTLADEAIINATITGAGYAGTGSFTLGYTDASFNAGSYTFDTFAMRPSTAASTATSMDTTRFMVQVIPEPASATLAAFGGLATLAFRRRR